MGNICETCIYRERIDDFSNALVTQRQIIKDDIESLLDMTKSVINLSNDPEFVTRSSPAFLAHVDREREGILDITTGSVTKADSAIGIIDQGLVELEAVECKNHDADQSRQCPKVIKLIAITDAIQKAVE